MVCTGWPMVKRWGWMRYRVHEKVASTTGAGNISSMENEYEALLTEALDGVTITDVSMAHSATKHTLAAFLAL